jgi:hypothetical protein
MDKSYPILSEGKAGKLLALTIPAALGFIVSIGVIELPVGWYRGRENKIALMERQAAQIAALQQAFPEMRKSILAAEAVADDRHLFLAGSSDAVASANLQSTIKLLASQSNAHLASTIVLPPVAVNGLRQIAINVNLTAKWQALIGLLSAIEVARPRVIVSDLDIRDSGSQQDIRSDAMLQISFTVAGFKRVATP